MARVTWVVLADSSRARIFETDDTLSIGPSVVEERVNPAGRMRERDLVSDGRSKSFDEGPGHSSDISQSDARGHLIERFAKDLAARLQTARQTHAFDELVLVCPPRYLGLLRKELDPATLDTVRISIDKELTLLPAGEVLEAVRSRAA